MGGMTRPPSGQPPDPTQADQYKDVCVPVDHAHTDPCWLAGWMAGHAAGYKSAREESAERMSMREAQAQIAELRAQMAAVQSRLSWSHTEGSTEGD